MRVTLGDHIVEINERTTTNNQHRVLTSSQKGIVSQDEYFNKQIASKENTGYKIVKRGQFTYRAMSDTGRFYINRLMEYDVGIVSPAYPVFEVIEDNIIYTPYIVLFFESDYFQSLIVNQSTGSTRVSLKLEKIKRISIDIPSYQEQKEIVEKIESAKRAIAARDEQLSCFNELVKSRFIELFESKSWETVRADSIMFNMRNGVSPSNTGKYLAKVLTLSAITQGDFDSSSWKDGMFEVEPPIEKRVTSSDFYMCRGNGNKNLVGAGVYSKENRYDLVFPDTVIAATVDLQRVCLPYLFHSWMRPSVRDQIEAGARTTNGTYKINQGVVSNIELMLPPLELQNVFAAFVEQTDKSKLCGEMEVAA